MHRSTIFDLSRHGDSSVIPTPSSGRCSDCRRARISSRHLARARSPSRSSRTSSLRTSRTRGRNSATRSTANWGTGIGDAITNALTSAFSAHGFGGIIEAFGRGALSSLGGVFKQMGAAWIAYGVIAAKLVPSIANPITSGFAAIAIGSALVALGAGLSAAVSGRSGGGGSGSYYSGAPPQIIDRGVINPSLVNAGAGCHR
jgi:hypothetical protein